MNRHTQAEAEEDAITRCWVIVSDTATGQRV